MTQYLNPPVISAQSNVSNLWSLVDTVSNYAAVVAQGYLTAQQDLGHVFYPNDVIYVSYVGGAGFFKMSFSGDLITLAPAIVTLNTNLSAQVPISASEFNGMYDAPKLLVAAPGANEILIHDSTELVLTYNANAYAAGGTVAVQYDSTVHGAGVIASTTLANTAFQVTASNVFTFNRGVVALPFSSCVNKGLYLSNISGAFTTGDSAMVANVYYKILSVA